MAICVVLFTAGVFAQDIPREPAVRYIEAVGEADTNVVPDLAYARVGLVGRGRTAEQALRGIAAPAKRMQELLQQLRIDSARIRTIAFTVGPVPEREERPRRDGESPEFRAERVLRVRFSDFDSLRTFLLRAVETGANRLEGVEFEFSRRESLEAALLMRAIDDARSAARTMAEGLGVSLGDVISASQGDIGLPFGPFPMRAAAEAGFAARDLSPETFSVYPGETRVTMRVPVRFGIR